MHQQLHIFAIRTTLYLPSFAPIHFKFPRQKFSIQRSKQKNVKKITLNRSHYDQQQIQEKLTSASKEIITRWPFAFFCRLCLRLLAGLGMIQLFFYGKLLIHYDEQIKKWKKYFTAIFNHITSPELSPLLSDMTSHCNNYNHLCHQCVPNLQISHRIVHPSP